MIMKSANLSRFEPIVMNRVISVQYDLYFRLVIQITEDPITSHIHVYNIHFLTKEEMETERLGKYSGISLAAVLAIGFVLVQPTMNQAYAVGIEGLPAYDGCSVFDPPNEDPTSMNTVRHKDIVKTIHAEKEVFACKLEQGNL